MPSPENHKKLDDDEEGVFPERFHQDLISANALLKKAKGDHDRGESSSARYLHEVAQRVLGRLQRQFLKLRPEASDKSTKEAEKVAELLLLLGRMDNHLNRVLEKDQYPWKEDYYAIMQMISKLFRVSRIDQDIIFDTEVLGYAEEMIAFRKEDVKKDGEGDPVSAAIWTDFGRKTSLFRERLLQRGRLEEQDTESKNPQDCNEYLEKDQSHDDISNHASGGDQEIPRQHANGHEHNNSLEHDKAHKNSEVQPADTKSDSPEPPPWLGLNGHEEETEKWLAAMESSSRAGNHHVQTSNHFVAHNSGVGCSMSLSRTTPYPILPPTPWPVQYVSFDREVEYDPVDLRREFQEQEKLEIYSKRLVIRLKHLEFALDLYNAKVDGEILRYAKEIAALAKGKGKADDGYFGDNRIPAAEDMKNIGDDIYYALKEYYLRMYGRMRLVRDEQVDGEVMAAVTKLIERAEREKPTA